MNKNINCQVFKASFAFLALIGAAQITKADLVPYPNSGVPNPDTYTFTATTSGDIIAYFAGTGAAYDEQLGMLVNGTQTAQGFGLDNHSSSIGNSFNLGYANAGDTLTFVIHVNDTQGYVYSDPALNGPYDSDGSVGHNHVYSTAYTATSPLYSGIPVGTYVGFEDLRFPDSDFNYYDESFVFTGVSSTTYGSVPEPSTVVAGALLLLPFGASTLRIMRKKQTA